MLTGEMMILEEGGSDRVSDTNTLSEMECTESDKTFFGDGLDLDSSSLSCTGTAITDPRHTVMNTFVVCLIIVVCLCVYLSRFPG